MRVFAVSDIHVDYDVNARWVQGLSKVDFTDDVLVLAGDVSDSTLALAHSLEALARRFRSVLYVPGNHDLWVIREDPRLDSLAKFEVVRKVVRETGASMETLRHERLVIVPLLSWYDYSFGQPARELRAVWMDFRACRWPGDMQPADIAAHFAGLNPVERVEPVDGPGTQVISFSHFLPRIDVMPSGIPPQHRVIYPVLGSTRIDQQLRALGSTLHVYGHSHVNRRVRLDGVDYVNNALGYPHEGHIAADDIVCIHEAA